MINEVLVWRFLRVGGCVFFCFCWFFFFFVPHIKLVYLAFSSLLNQCQTNCYLRKRHRICKSLFEVSMRNVRYIFPAIDERRSPAKGKSTTSLQFNRHCLASNCWFCSSLLQLVMESWLSSGDPTHSWVK